ncbi:MAG: insulinase family protein [Nitriliruptorales bacterium]|nr:insulinase family protein [Nitriliruptorales bacterium]
MAISPVVAARAASVAPDLPMVRARLDNGLRVVLAPDASAAVVAVAVTYDVGIRSEPEGRTGFAHLFEHLMFQGSEHIGKTEHFTYVQGAGGTLNGTTRMDYTNYYEMLPAQALELALFLEADRMRSVRLTQENLENQVAVVKEEIRVNVLNRPYGGFPWLLLPPVLFETFPNAHDGYGDFRDLEAATIADAESFFERYYAPANAALSIAGDVDVDAALALVERHFSTIAPRPAPPRPSFAEPPPTRERRGMHVDPLAPQPALAVGYRLPDPLEALDEFLPFVLLIEALAEGDASRLQRRLVQRDRLVTDIAAGIGVMGGATDGRDPTPLIVQARHPATTGTEDVLAALDDEFARVTALGLEDGELQRLQARWVGRYLRRIDHVMARAQTLGVQELQRGRPELLTELPALIAAVDAERVQRAAAGLRPDARAVLELRGGAA